MRGRPEPGAAIQLFPGTGERATVPAESADGGRTRARPDTRPAPSAPLTDYASMYDLLTGVVRRVCPMWLVDGREDILQAAMVRVLETKRTSEPGRGVSPSYLWKVAYTATIDEIRREQRKRARFSDGDTPLDMEPAAESDPLERLESRDLGEEIRVGLLRLSRRRRLVVGLHLMGSSVSEIMETTGWGNRKVRNLLCRGLHEVRDHLRSKGWRR